MTTKYRITKTTHYARQTETSRQLTLSQAVKYYAKTLERGVYWSTRSKGGTQINTTPETIDGLIESLNAASANSNLDRVGDTFTYEECVRSLA